MSTEMKARLATAMAELLRRQGYAATSVKQVTAAAGAPMGSLYHHFPGGKRQLAAEALRSTGAAYIGLLPLLVDPYDDLPEAITAFFATAADDLEQTGWANMCPVGTVAGEIADAEPDLRQVAAEVIDGWLATGVAYFTGREFAGFRLTEPDARDLVAAMLGALEGSFILARTLRSTAPLLSAGTTITAYARSLVGAKRARGTKRATVIGR